MKALLSKVDDVFALEQGRLLVPGIPVHIEPKSGIKIGDELELRFPDGTRKTTHVSGLMVLCGTPDEPPVPIGLPREFAKADIPLKTELWVEEGKIR